MRFRPALLLLGAFLLGCADVFSSGADARTPAGEAGEAGAVQYLERVSGGANPGERLPMVVLIHGRGGSPERYESLAASLRARARVILPYGEPGPKGFQWWNEKMAKTDPEVMAARVERAGGRVAAMIEDVSRRRPTAGRAVVFGHSQGGTLAYALAVRHPELVSCAFPMSGQLPHHLWPSAWNNGRPKPRIFAFHGANDTQAPVDRDRATVVHLRSLGLWVEYNETQGAGHAMADMDIRSVLARIDQAAEQEAAGAGVAPQVSSYPR
jgi:phospholipase/carboxylesterase